MKLIECQGKTIVTTTAVADAVVAFYAAAHRRGRTVRVDVPAVNEGPQNVPLILFPGEKLTVLDCAMPPVELDATSLIQSLTSRRLAWIPRAAAGA